MGAGTLHCQARGREVGRVSDLNTAVLRDPHYVAHAQEWTDRLHAYLASQIGQRMGLDAGTYSLEFRLIGMNAALGSMENRRGEPIEVGGLGLITAQTAETAE